jgi:LPXTG-motif cell wall-anchored protein
MAKTVPQQVTERSARTKIFDWQVPLRAGATAGAISGELFWRGSAGGAPVGAVVALGAIVLLGAGAVVIVRRRRRGPDSGSRGAVPGVPRAAAGSRGRGSKPRGEAW